MNSLLFACCVHPCMFLSIHSNLNRPLFSPQKVRQQVSLSLFLPHTLIGSPGREQCVRIRSLSRQVIFLLNSLGLQEAEKDRCVDVCEHVRLGEIKSVTCQTGFWQGHHLALGSKAHPAWLLLINKMGMQDPYPGTCVQKHMLIHTITLIKSMVLLESSHFLCSFWKFCLLLFSSSTFNWSVCNKLTNKSIWL